jgi:hypothetical protein
MCSHVYVRKRSIFFTKKDRSRRRKTGDWNNAHREEAKLSINREWYRTTKSISTEFEFSGLGASFDGNGVSWI